MEGDTFAYSLLRADLRPILHTMECEVDLWNLFVRLILHRSGCIVCPLFILPVHAGQPLYADLVPVDYAVVLVAGFKEAIVW